MGRQGARRNLLCAWGPGPVGQDRRGDGLTLQQSCDADHDCAAGDALPLWRGYVTQPCPSVACDGGTKHFHTCKNLTFCKYHPMPKLKPKNPLPLVIVILGPTATGKSDLAVTLAKRLNGEVISADSRQVYRGLTLGTGKITKKEMKGVPHHLLDVANPKKQFTVSDFVKMGEEAMTDILKRGKLPIICGGTGFYISALLGEVSMPEVPPNKKLREKLSKLSKEELFARLKKKDPKRARTIDKDNPVRLVRAIEIADALGSVPPSRARSANYAVIKIGLDFPDAVLKERIAKRLEARMKKGMLKEAERLHDDSLSFKRMEGLGLEYRYLARLLQKKITKQQFTEELQSEIWHYVKRQRTWFKRDKTISWIKVQLD